MADRAPSPPQAQVPSLPLLTNAVYQHWQGRAKMLGPGAEYDLVDEFSDMMVLRDWSEWRPDPGQHETPAE